MLDEILQEAKNSIICYGGDENWLRGNSLNLQSQNSQCAFVKSIINFRNQHNLLKWEWIVVYVIHSYTQKKNLSLPWCETLNFFECNNGFSCGLDNIGFGQHIFMKFLQCKIEGSWYQWYHLLPGCTSKKFIYTLILDMCFNSGLYDWKITVLLTVLTNYFEVNISMYWWKTTQTYYFQLKNWEYCIILRKINI